MSSFDEKYCLDQFQKLLAIDSTTGQFREIQTYAETEIAHLGFVPQTAHKGGVLADLGGEGDPLAVTAHLDDIGLMVRHINGDGTLNVCPVVESTASSFRNVSRHLSALKTGIFRSPLPSFRDLFPTGKRIPQSSKKRKTCPRPCRCARRPGMV